MLLSLLFHSFAKAYQDGGNFFILLIITDGVINDMPQTKIAIINVSVKLCRYSLESFSFVLWSNDRSIALILYCRLLACPWLSLLLVLETPISTVNNF